MSKKIYKERNILKHALFSCKQLQMKFAGFCEIVPFFYIKSSDVTAVGIILVGIEYLS